MNKRIKRKRAKKELIRRLKFVIPVMDSHSGVSRKHLLNEALKVAKKVEQREKVLTHGYLYGNVRIWRTP